MMFEQCKIVIFNNIIFMKKHRKIFRKNSMEIFRNFPEKYEIFRTNFLPHITIYRNIHPGKPSIPCLHINAFECRAPNQQRSIYGFHQLSSTAKLIKKEYYSLSLISSCKNIKGRLLKRSSNMLYDHKYKN